MQLTDLLCYLLLTITITATCTKGEEERQKRELSVGRPKRVLKRDAAIFIDNFPVEPVYSHKPKVIYRRVSKQRYGSPKPKYGPPRPKYGPPPKHRKPAKKHRKQISSKYGPPSHKKRAPKPRYGPPKRPSNAYGPPKKVPPHYYAEPAGFGEPPADYEPQTQKHNYAEPPVDSYGALKSPVIDNYPPTSPSFNEPPSFDNQDFTNFGQDTNSWQNFPREPNQDNTYAYSKKRPLFVRPDEIFDQQQTPDEEDINLNSYSDVFSYSHHHFKEPPYLSNRKKKPQFFGDTKKINKHWKSPKLRPQEKDPSDEILVGGQYAEPPPRYVPKFQPSAPMYNGDDDFNPPQRYIDSDVAASATISPYVNYKHSNMAFSPQNLNDAFSIVDK